MIRNYIKTTLRSLSKNKGYSFLNIAGLAIGIACASLIFLWVQDELSYNHNFVKRDNLYTIYENQTYNEKVSTFHATPGLMAAAIKTEIPGIRNAARLDGMGSAIFSMGDKIISQKGCYADGSIFSMLKLPFAYGNVNAGFPQLHSVVIDESMAKRFFGDVNPIGKTLRMNNQQDYTVAAVFKDLPKNSTYKFEWLASMDNIINSQPWMSIWGANWARTLVELDPSASITSINNKLEHYIASKTKNTNNTVCFLFAMNNWNLHDNFIDGKMDGGRITYVRLFALIAFLILIIACINFMNLSTARSEQRAKEVGVRKVMGAGKGKLIAQFIGEAVIMSFIAVIVSVGIVFIVAPAFNSLVQKDLAVGLLQPLHLTYLITICLITGLLSGSYPAFYLSSFNPIAVLKNIKIKSGTASGIIRQSLVVLQFAASIVLIIGTVIIYQQIQHVKGRKLGYNKSNLVYVTLQGKMADNFPIVYNDLKKSGFVQDAALSDDPVLEVGSNSDNYSWAGKDASKNPLISWQKVSPQFISTMGMQLAAGRDFNPIAAVDSNNVIINEAFAKQMGKEGRVGAIITEGGHKRLQITGIVKDFLYNDMYASAQPVLLYCQPVGTRVLTIRFKQNVNMQHALQKAGTIIKADNPGYPFDYLFVDNDFEQLFKTETLTGKLAGVFASLAVFISCLGLFGLAAYTAERRIKEIGIRKVLGASVAGLTGLLSCDFLKLVGISCLIAFPVAWWAINNWLQSYQYRVSINWSVFAMAGILAMLIALVTVSFQAIKAALMNPVKSLRSE